MPNRFLCPKCRGQRVTCCTHCGGSGKRSIAGITTGHCKECNRTGQCRCDVCGGTGGIEAVQPRRSDNHASFARQTIPSDRNLRVAKELRLSKTSNDGAGMSNAPLIGIVDDDALVLDGIEALVESLGYNPATFMSAEHFLRSDVIVETTCLITDVQMPGLSGLELQEALQSLGHQTPVIVITGYPNEKHRTRALENGAVGYLSKPLDEQTLIDCLTVAIKLRSSQARRRRTA